MNRRLLQVLSAVAIASLTAGCATFSDSGNIARVGDETLTDDDLRAQLTELDAPDDQLLPAEAVRAQITTWIQQQLAGDDTPGLDPDDIARRYDAGLESSGTVCISGIVVADEETARDIAEQLGEGADFDELLETENLDPSLAEAGGNVGCVTSDQVDQAVDVEFVQVAATLDADDDIDVSPLFDTTGAEFAWVVLVFRPFDELADADAELVTAAIETSVRLADADVFVDPRYGTFDTATGQVVPLG